MWEKHLKQYSLRWASFEILKKSVTKIVYVIETDLPPYPIVIKNNQNPNSLPPPQVYT